jgi:hypothetical protein
VILGMSWISLSGALSPHFFPRRTYTRLALLGTPGLGSGTWSEMWRHHHSSAAFVWLACPAFLWCREGGCRVWVVMVV